MDINMIKNSTKVFSIALLVTSGALIAAPSVVEKRIDFTIEHPFKTFYGEARTIQIDGIEPSITRGAISISAPFTVTIPILSLKTGNASRDSNMYRVLGHPDQKSVVAKFSTIRLNQDAFSVTGTLAINGHEHPFETKGSVTREGESFLFTGEFPVSLTKYEVERPELLLVPIDDTVKVSYRFRIQ
jgi:polyisoprenoid-binding protein YceI